MRGTKQSLKSIEPPNPVIARHEAIPKIDRTSLSCHCEETKQSLKTRSKSLLLSLRGNEAIPKIDRTS
ncbi:hypothetical protein ACN4EE_17750 [Geminocystis sp. CENA526]|uniref:hypothetical protein n=1 Tax=Geminocystis sp. CENA526 TaxID=1355871 RepID=UPI003D6E4378